MPNSDDEEPCQGTSCDSDGHTTAGLEPEEMECLEPDIPVDDVAAHENCGDHAECGNNT